MATLFTINPSRRKRRAGGKKRRSAKQRAATRKMLAARFGVNPRKRRSKRRSRKSGKVAAYVKRAVRRGRRSVRKMSRRRGRRSSMRFSTGNAVNLLKAGAIGGAGAVLVDIGMGQVARFLPAALATPMDSAGNVQYGYFGAKAALAIALGTYGGKIMPGAIAEKMGEGALTVLAYQFLRPMVPAGLALGYFNPAPTMRPGVGRAGAYVSGAGAYARLPVRAGNGNGGGGRAANVLNMISTRRQAA